MVGGCAAAVAADEAHDRSALALSLVVEEVADDQAQVLEIPVERLQVPGRLQHDVTEALDLGRLPRWPLGGVHPRHVVPDVERQGLLRGQRGKLMRVGDHADLRSAGVDQIHRHPAEAFRQALDRPPGRLGEPQHVVRLGGPERGADEPGPRTSADEHAGGSGVGAAQLQLVPGAQRCREAEGAGEDLGPLQIRLLELQPRQVVHLEDRVAGPPGVLAPQRALLAVQTRVGIVPVDHVALLSNS